MADAFRMAQDRYLHALLLHGTNEFIGTTWNDQIDVFAQLKKVRDLLARIDLEDEPPDLFVTHKSTHQRDGFTRHERFECVLHQFSENLVGIFRFGAALEQQAVA